jgi:hypothetical protein
VCPDEPQKSPQESGKSLKSPPLHPYPEPPLNRPQTNAGSWANIPLTYHFLFYIFNLLKSEFLSVITSGRTGGLKTVNPQNGLELELPKGDASLVEQFHLIKPTILFFLRSDIRPDRLLIHPNSRNKITPGPEMSPSKVLSLPRICPRNLDGALPLKKPYHLRYGVLGRSRDQLVYRVGLEMPF